MIAWLIDIKTKFTGQPFELAKPPKVVPLAAPFELAANLAVVIREQPHGFTWCPRSMSLVTAQHDDDFCVSRVGFEKRLRCMPPDGLDLVEWIVKASEWLRFDGEFCGGWPDGNVMYVLDVSVVIRGLAHAIEFGLGNRQTSICHLRTGSGIDLGPCRS